MFKASTILQDARLDREYELSEISKKLKIPLKYLSALETGDTNNYPPEPYCSLYVKAYADSLGLNSQHILTLFRRDFDRQPQPVNSFYRRLRGFTPQATFSLAIVIVIFLFSSYLVNEYLKFSRPPFLQVNWPTGQIVGHDYDLSGVTNPEATVRINHDLVVVDQTGRFTYPLPITPPETKVTIEAKSPSGKITIEEKTITSN